MWSWNKSNWHLAPVETPSHRLAGVDAWAEYIRDDPMGRRADPDLKLEIVTDRWTQRHEY